MKDFLYKKGYVAIKLKLIKTNHFEIKATVNGAKGRFILDTGASSSCVGFEFASFFELTVEDSEIKASGAGTSSMPVKISKKNIITIGKWKQQRMTLVLLDLTHINTALTTQGAVAVNGIIGADILKKGKAIIDYHKKYLYLLS